MFFGDVTQNISGIMKHSAYNHFIFIRQKIKNEMTRFFYGSPRSGATQHYVITANVFADFGSPFASWAIRVFSYITDSLLEKGVVRIRRATPITINCIGSNIE